MALTVITDITDYQLSKNPVVLQLETDAYEVDPGTKASIQLDISTANGANAVGGTFLLRWSSDGVIFTVATTPDDSGYQVRPKAALSDSQFCVQLIEDISKNYKLTEAYTITRSSNDIILTAKVEGEEFSLYDNSESTDFGYVLNSTHVDGEDPEYAENYKMRADLWMETYHVSGIYEKKGTIELDPLDSKCIFDFKDQINANLTYDLPTYGQSLPGACLNVLKRFYVRYLEKYGDPVGNRQINTTAVGYAIKAGIPTQLFVDTDNHIESLYRTPGRFLTRQPRTKKIREDQQEFLYFCMNEIDSIPVGGPEIHLRITIYKNDNTDNVTVNKTPLPTGEYRVHCFPVGYSALNLAASATWDKVKKYTVEIYSDADTEIISEAFTFIPDTDFYIDEKYFFFTNSDGGFDTFRSTGINDTNFDTEKEIVQKTINFNTPVINGEMAEVSHFKTDKFKAATGWLNRAQVDWLEDFFLSENKYVDINGQFIPIIITSNTFKKYNASTSLFFYELEYVLAYKNRVPQSLEMIQEEGS